MQWLNTSQETCPEALSVTCGHRGRLPQLRCRLDCLESRFKDGNEYAGGLSGSPLGINDYRRGGKEARSNKERNIAAEKLQGLGRPHGGTLMPG